MKRSFGILITLIIYNAIDSQAMSIAGAAMHSHELLVSDSLIAASDSSIISLNLNEILITATESRQTPSASVIGKQAMEHLQPTSFSDILELLPGGKTQTPDMNSASLIRLREAGSTSEVMASLGVKFVIDGIAIDNDANLQYNPSSSNDRTYVSKGVDMRSVQTDNIESVEIVRGIPSVVYGDLTSGLVNIIRKSGSSPLSARIKVDEYGKLFSVGKGFKTGSNTFLNADVNYTDSKTDPRLPLENYKRITFSSRLVHKYTGDNILVRLNLSSDYTGSFDNQKNDPEITGNQYDRFKSAYNKFSLAATTKLYFTELKYFTELDLKGAMTASYDRLEQTKFISLSRPMPVASSLFEGEFDGEYLPYQYVADLIVDGRPVNGNFSAIGRFDFNANKIKSKLLIGTEWKMSGNNGDGRIYDVTRPMSSTSTRPSSYKDIPFMHNIAFFAEENLSADFDGHKLDVMAGVRTLSLLNLDSRYTMKGKIYVEPRINIRYNLPSVIIMDKTLKTDISLGIGSHIKAPTLDMLYPDARYEDIVQLNYYHNNPDYRVINYRTYCIDVTNYDLKPARNNKYELRGGISYDGFNFSVTYFREYMNDGFRQVTDFRALSYKNYDTGSVNSSEITSKPQVSDFSYENDSVMKLYNVWDNQTKTHKEGIEFTLSTKRFETIKTRLTINGAWFKTTTSNAGYEYYRPGTVLNGRPFNYIGIYDWEGGYEKNSFNTNFMFDTYLKRLGLIFSTSLQCTWSTSSRPLYNDGTPKYYVDMDGNIHHYTEESKNDPILGWFVKGYSDEYFNTTKVPFAGDINLKATKEFGKYARISLFVNKMITIYPDYYSGSRLIRRSGSPYFGMEMSFSL